MSLFDSDYLQVKFMPKHPEKCLNYNGKMIDKKIHIRSSWELILANWLDLNNNILEWGSEIVEIPYYSSIDNKTHRYITDFLFTCKDRQGNIMKYLVEVKPESQVPKLNENGQIIFNENTLEELKEFIYCNTYTNDSFLNVEDLMEAGRRELSFKSHHGFWKPVPKDIICKNSALW